MQVKLVRYLANLGYGSRRQVKQMLDQKRVYDTQGHVFKGHEMPSHHSVRVDGEALDPPAGMVIMLNKPAGMTCSHQDAGKIVYTLLPPRFLARKPVVSTIGRLDKATTGLLLLSDNGDLIHRLTSPHKQVAKTYEVWLADDLRGDEAAVFASGELTLRSESEPLAPAWMSTLTPRRARIVITEGRYHQVRRMFAAVGHHVEALHRVTIGGLTLGSLEPGQWQFLEREALAAAFWPVDQVRKYIDDVPMLQTAR